MARIKKQYIDQELSDLMKTFCRKLRIFRVREGLSQNQLAKKSGIAVSTINEIENKLATDIRFSTMTAVASALRRKSIEFLTESDLNLTDPDRRVLLRACEDLQKIHEKIRDDEHENSD